MGLILGTNSQDSNDNPIDPKDYSQDDMCPAVPIQKKKEDIINKNLNIIKMVIELDKDDINKYFKFIYNIPPIDMNSFPNIKELSENNTELFINGQKHKYKPYFLPEKAGKYEIELRINNPMKNCGFLFYGCHNMINVDLSLFSTKDATNMEYMFNECSNLTKIDLSSFNTLNVTNMISLFRGCSKLKYIDLSSFNTKNVTNMNSMFCNCSNLEKIDLSSFFTENVTDMGNMFYNCQKLKNVDLSSFETRNVYNMENMFSGCSNLVNLDVTSFNTKKVQSMEQMFFNCSNLKNLDLSSFYTSYFDYYNYCRCDNILGNCYNLKSVVIQKDSRIYETIGYNNNIKIIYV